MTPKPGIDYIGVAAGAMIFNHNGELFLAKRSQNVKNERGCWETPGGGVEFGETLEEAARREILEEYGVEIEIVDTFPAVDHLIPAEGQHWVAVTFLATLKPDREPRIMEPEKCDEIGWFALDALPTPLSIITQVDLRLYRARPAMDQENVND
ncbi:MAG TPA: NUDIX domain-containing protein [Candidatus Saccharimonadia bacterium]|nr:NUDIX domain-containing protein [Candidatus Saccharimonadia bacterium]